MAATEPITGATTATSSQEKGHRSVFDLPQDFFDSCRLFSPLASSLSEIDGGLEEDSARETLDETDDFEKEDKSSRNVVDLRRWTCNTCKTEFESLQEQRSHFKSDIHRFNVKLTIAGKDIVKEEDLEEWTSESFNDFEISSISGSEDEVDKFSHRNDPSGRLIENIRKKLFIRLRTGERVSIWKCLLLSETESVNYENDKAASVESVGCLTEREVIERLNGLIREPRNNTCVRVVLLAKAGHFAGCVFDGNTIVAHKTFHRYVVRAKAGKRQSSKDASGRTVHSAGASLRRYNELALKKDVQELLSSWKPYFDASICVFIHAPSANRQLLFDGDKPYFSNHHCAIQYVPLTVRRPTLKEAHRVYKLLTQAAYEEEETKVITPVANEKSNLDTSSVSAAGPSLIEEEIRNSLDLKETAEASSSCKQSHEQSVSSESETEVIGTSTALHEASQSGNSQKVLELLEQGLDPCIKDERGRTPYMLATEKEVRNTFRRFMASNLDRWDWLAAKVPSALTKEMEESQAAKQAEKDAKKKARAKELKKLRKAREKKKAEAEAALPQNTGADLRKQSTLPSVIKGQSQSQAGRSQLSKEEELKRIQAAEREKRAAAAERRMAAAATQVNTNVEPATSQSKSRFGSEASCSCCGSSLAGKVPFHRYNYKYCSTTCMHVHREALEDG